jgi:hypothetical protein
VTFSDRETVSLLKTVLDRVWGTVPPGERAKISQAMLAERILQAAAQGERDPECLCAPGSGRNLDQSSLELRGAQDRTSIIIAKIRRNTKTYQVIHIFLPHPLCQVRGSRHVTG